LSVKIRKVRPRDLPRIVDCYGRVGDSPTDPFSNVRRLGKLDHSNLLIAERDGQFAGFLYYFVHRKPWFDPSVRRYGFIQELHVLPEFRGLGVGTALLKNALSKMEGRRIRVVYVETGENNSAALHVYRKIGFEDFRRTIMLKRMLNLQKVSS
jgi:ribosomal protein S18 acetylase RimI-like enzyme